MAVLDFEDVIFTTVTCTNCRYTDLFKTSEASFLGMVADAMFT